VANNIINLLTEDVMTTYAADIEDSIRCQMFRIFSSFSLTVDQIKLFFFLASLYLRIRPKSTRVTQSRVGSYEVERVV
jgi:hypothetical protein